MARSVVCYNGAAFDYSGGAITSFPGAVTSVFGRTGAVVAASNDYSEAQISFSDITTNNVSTSKHGYTPKLPNDATKYLDGTGAYSVPSGSGGGIGAVLFDSTLGANTASIDTGSGGIAGGYHMIDVMILARTSQSATFSSLLVTVNNDSNANYDLQRLQGLNASVSSGPVRASNQWTFDAPGANAGASYPTMIRMRFLGYTQTTFFKVGECTQSEPDQTAANTISEVIALGYRSTTAISQMKVLAGASSNLLAGSRLTVIGW